jgi:hypothetical protein
VKFSVQQTAQLPETLLSCLCQRAAGKRRREKARIRWCCAHGGAIVRSHQNTKGSTEHASASPLTFMKVWKRPVPQPTSATVISAGFKPLERMNSARGTRAVRCKAQTQDQHVIEAVHHNMCV